MAPVLLDTTVLIDLLRGTDGAVRRVRELKQGADEAWACALNVEETVRGLRHNELDATRALLRGLRIAPLGREEGWRAGEWRRDFAARGVTLSQADCLIAAAALGIRARLATGNPSDFPMAEVPVEHWPAGES